MQDKTDGCLRLGVADTRILRGATNASARVEPAHVYRFGVHRSGCRAGHATKTHRLTLSTTTAHLNARLRLVLGAGKLVLVVPSRCFGIQRANYCKVDANFSKRPRDHRPCRKPPFAYIRPRALVHSRRRVWRRYHYYRGARRKQSWPSQSPEQHPTGAQLGPSILNWGCS